MELLVRKILVMTGEGKLDYNYNYELMQRLYEALTLIDDEKALYIHDKGISVDKKRFKLFNYTLYFDKEVEYLNDGISFNNDNSIRLILSGDTDILNPMIKGLIAKQTITLNGVELKIQNMEDDKKFNFKNIMLYKVRSPIVETIFNGEQIEYLNPCQENWYSALANNLKRKYKAVYNEEYEGELFFDIEDILKVKKKMINKIKKGFLIGYTDFEIFIQATPKMQKIAYNLGLGQNSSLGMGAISYIKGWNDEQDI